MLAEITASLSGKPEPLSEPADDLVVPFTSFSTAYVRETLISLPSIKTDISVDDEDADDSEA